MGIFDSFANIGATAMSNAVNKEIARQNMQFQKDHLAMQLQMQQQAWAREDNAIQRRAADLQAAGINPILAAGSAAASSSPIHTTAPQMNYHHQAPHFQGGVLDAMRALEEIKHVKAQTELVKEQARQTSTYTNQSVALHPEHLRKLQFEAQDVAVRWAKGEVELDRATAELEELLTGRILHGAERDKVRAEIARIFTDERLTRKQLEQITWDLMKAKELGVMMHAPSGVTGQAAQGISALLHWLKKFGVMK